MKTATYTQQYWKHSSDVADINTLATLALQQPANVSKEKRKAAVGYGLVQLTVCREVELGDLSIALNDVANELRTQLANRHRSMATLGAE